MPFYVYRDKSTNEKVEIMMTVSEMSRRQRKDGTIVHDGRTLVRDVASEHRASPKTSACWPMLSDAAGVHPDQCGKAYEESVRLGAPTRFNPETGQAIFESRGHRKAYLRAKGMFDRNGGYGD